MTGGDEVATLIGADEVTGGFIGGDEVNGLLEQMK